MCDECLEIQNADRTYGHAIGDPVDVAGLLYQGSLVVEEGGHYVFQMNPISGHPNDEQKRLAKEIGNRYSKVVSDTIKALMIGRI